MRFLKSYFPMFISILFMFILSFMIVFSFNSNAVNDTSAFAWIVVAITAILVIGIWAEIIGFIIHAANNKLLKNSIVWCLVIYILNVFVIPYYNLKYVVKEKKIALSMIVFGILMVVSVSGGIFCSLKYFGSVEEKVLYVEVDDAPVKFKFHGFYTEREVGSYDVYVSDYSRGINVGSFIYQDDTDVSDIMLQRDSWIKTTRKNVVVLDEDVLELNDRKITSNVYLGTNDGERFVYKISAVEFLNSDVLVNVIEVCFYEDYDKYKGELEQVLVDVEYIGTNQM